jgi:hypothetical protein
VSFEQATKILPFDTAVRELILHIEREFEALLSYWQREATHLPSRLRSLLWLQAALPIMASQGYPIARAEELRAHLAGMLPRTQRHLSRSA